MSNFHLDGYPCGAQCGISKHKHKTEEEAAECVRKRAIRFGEYQKQRKRRVALGQTRLKSHRDRDIKITRSMIDGDSSAGKLNAENHGISTYGVYQIVYRTCRHSLRTLNGKDIAPPCSHRTIGKIREHKDFWLHRLDIMERMWKQGETDE